MEPLAIRPSLRQANFLLVLCFVPLAAMSWFVFAVSPESSKLLLLVAALPLLFPMKMYVGAWSTHLTIDGETVRFRQGLFGQTARAMNLSRVQDVSVERSLWQRVWGTGALILETASESGRIVMPDIDRPQQIADLILAASRNSHDRAST